MIFLERKKDLEMIKNGCFKVKCDNDDVDLTIIICYFMADVQKIHNHNYNKYTVGVVIVAIAASAISFLFFNCEKACRAPSQRVMTSSSSVLTVFSVASHSSVRYRGALNTEMNYVVANC